MKKKSANPITEVLQKGIPNQVVNNRSSCLYSTFSDLNCVVGGFIMYMHIIYIKVHSKQIKMAYIT